MTVRLLSFEEYKDRYSSARMRRDDKGILEVTFHTEGGSLRWSELSQNELGMIFKCIAADRDNRIVIMTGTGDEWSGPASTWTTRFHQTRPTPEKWDEVIYFGRQLQMNMLDIEVPVIFALNGPPYRHSEIPLLADIVIASEDSVFEDVGHLQGASLVPGDGINVVYGALLGPNRARYFHLMGQRLDAKQALDLGLVGEVLPKDKTLARAWEIAEQLIKKPDMLLRYTRLIFTQPLKEVMLRHLGLGLALEGLAAVSTTSSLEKE